MEKRGRRGAEIVGHESQRRAWIMVYEDQRIDAK